MLHCSHDVITTLATIVELFVSRGLVVTPTLLLKMLADAFSLRAWWYSGSVDAPPPYP